MITMKLTKLHIDAHKVQDRVDRASVPPVRECGLLVEREAKKSMKAGGARGRIGPRGGYIRVASVPGTPPNVQTGALRASIQTAMTARKTAVVGPTEKYGKVHEFGTRTHPQRPFMRPAFRRVQQKFARKFINLRFAP